MYQEARSPRDLVGWTTLSTNDQILCKGGGVRLLQLEYDLFDDHDSVRDEIQNWVSNVNWRGRAARHDAARRGGNFFELIRRTVHATAVASIIKDVNFGIAPDVLFHFEPSDVPQKTSDFAKLGKKLRKHGLVAGDIISISLQVKIPVVGDDPRHLPIDFDMIVRDTINDMVRRSGLIVFIAAGNELQDLDTIEKPADGADLSKYADCHSDSEAILVGYSSNDGTDALSSNFGRLIELGAPAGSVLAACYNSSGAEGLGDLLDATSSGFCRTSAATPMIASMAACIQGAYKQLNSGKVLSKEALLNVLRSSGSVIPPTGSPVGVFPNFPRALEIVKGLK